jgi:phospholipid/cholesterol/gamma-HCH transport system substrate-binding protein
VTRIELRETFVGALAVNVLALLLIASYTAQRIGEETGFGGYRLTAVFNRIDGLDVGDEVMLSGVRVGEVEAMSLRPDYRAQVTMLVDDDVALPEDTSASIHTDGLFGGKFVALDPGGSLENLTGGATIRYSQDAVLVQDLLDLIISEGMARQARGGGEAPASGPADAPPGGTDGGLDNDLDQIPGSGPGGGSGNGLGSGASGGESGGAGAELPGLLGPAGGNSEAP